MRRRLTFTLLLFALHSSHSLAQTIDWTGGGPTDQWDDKPNWTANNIPDAAGETAQFNVAGGFPVELPGDFTIDDLISLSGLPQLRPSAGVNPTLTVSDDLLATGGGFYLSTTNDEKFTVEVNDALRIDGGGSFTADTSGGAGGLVSILIDGLRLGDIGSGSGDLNLIGPNSTLDQTGLTTINLGQDGPAQFTLSDGARATFAAPIGMANLASGATSANVLVESGSRLNLNSLQLTTLGFFAGVSADLTVTGSSSVADLSGLLTIGGSSSATATVNVSNNGRLDVGGATTVNTNGILTIDSGGSFIARSGLDATTAGVVDVQNGTLLVENGSFRPLGASSAYVLDGDAAPADTAKVTVGAGATFSPGGTTRIGNAAGGTLEAAAGGEIDLGFVEVGGQAGSAGALIATGSETVFNTFAVEVGRQGSGSLLVEEGGKFEYLRIEVATAAGGDGAITVTGPGSRLVRDPNGNSATLILGYRDDGSLEVLDQGRVESSTMQVGRIGSTGDVNVLVDGVGSVLAVGSLSSSEVNSATVTASNGGFIDVAGASEIGDGVVVSVTGGGSFETGSFVDEGGRFQLLNGDLTVTSASRTLLVEPVGPTVDGVRIELHPSFSTASPTQLTSSHAIDMAGDIIVLPGAFFDIAGGTLSGEDLSLGAGASLRVRSSANVTTHGSFNMALGSAAEFDEDATLGDATAVNGVTIAGEIDTGANTLTLEDANDVVFDSGALVAFPASTSLSGEVAAANGATIDFGANFTGHGQITSPDDPIKPVINNGHLAGDSIARPITLTGYVKGVGTCDNCVITGTDAPGFSPATVIRGSVAYRGTLEIEIGGTGSGDFDRLEHLLGAGVIDLGGELSVELIDGYTPSAGDEFLFMTSNGGVFNTFDTIDLPEGAGGLSWDLQYGETIVALVVEGVAGDYNYDGLVDAADYTVWRDTLGQAGAGLAADGDNNGVVEQADYAIWQANYGATAASLATTVPEPSGAILALVGGLGLWRSRTHRLLKNIS
ncbi:hypothetical protein MalM25_25590 [Planctomycetes bacterium MalM25]|nr:hypothetical protein MalM25_25590 [Planctomycetes bacterium MalM25]